MNDLLDASRFLQKARRKLRFGTFSRVPVRLLRLEWKESLVECDWLMRPVDPYDNYVSERVADEHQTLQALRDALTLRDLVFKSFPRVATADLRMYRMDAEGELELMLTGSVHRANEVLRRVPSVAMRARLCGFRFSLAGGVLESMRSVPVGC